MPAPLALQERYWFSRFVFLRLLGLIYFVAFLSLSNQFAPLIGHNGLLPAQPYLDAVRRETGDDLSAFITLPTVFWWSCSDGMLAACAVIGVVGALLLLAGFANVPLLLLLWALYLSFVHIGQLFWGYGWEILLLETGFLAVFLVPLIDPRPRALAPPRLVIWMLRWLLFRVMFGAGLIKLRGDACWRDLTCMMFHYETQPLPNPASWYLHHLPAWVHSGEVLFNHFVELIAVWLLFLPRRPRHFGAACIVVFQLALIVSGNLSWLNWLTLALCVPCFDDAVLLPLLPRRMRARALEDEASIPIGRRVAVYTLAVVVVLLSYGPVANMLGPRQAMNRSFDPLHLVNTYGAFGSVGQVRHEVILEGTMDSNPSDGAEWREYEFKCKPGAVDRRPCIVAPYHYRLDWQIWFAAMATYRQNPWLIHFASKLLHGDRAAADLLAFNPFPNAPPKFVRAELYEYHFTSRSDATADWWQRQRIGMYLPPLSADDPALQNFLHANNWSDRSG